MWLPNMVPWVFNTLAWEISRYTTFRIEIQGHTESKTETGKENYGKWDLSADRANAARRKIAGTKRRGQHPGLQSLRFCRRRPDA